MPSSPLVVTHGGAGAPEAWLDGTDEAAERAWEAVESGQGALEAACRATALMEDDPRFNAGTGSHLRSDGATLEMDAAVATSRGGFGAVACLRRVRHPVQVARHVLGSDHMVLAGQGAMAFARDRGFPDHDPVTEGSRRRHKRALAKRQQGGSVDGGDTVGALVFDGEVLAAALSSGGTPLALPGRVGDVPLPGCGLAAGPAGAVACTGHGEAIAQRRTADAVYALLVDGQAPDGAVEAALAWFDHGPSFGLIVTDGEQAAGGSNREMPWSQRS